VKAILRFITIGLISVGSVSLISGPAQANDYGGASTSTARAAAFGMPNGCTSPLGDSPFKDGPWGPVSFRSACNDHDDCYLNHRRGDGEAGRLACDKDFLDNMRRLCDTAGLSHRELADCDRAAKLYYDVVRCVGGIFFWPRFDPTIFPDQAAYVRWLYRRLGLWDLTGSNLSGMRITCPNLKSLLPSRWHDSGTHPQRPNNGNNGHPWTGGNNTWPWTSGGDAGGGSPWTGGGSPWTGGGSPWTGGGSPWTGGGTGLPWTPGGLPQ